MLISPKSSLFSAVAAVLIAASMALGSACAGVVVIANRTAATVPLSVVEPDGSARAHSLAAGDVLPIPAAEKVGIAFDTQSGPRRMLARANALYYFMQEKETSQLNLLEVTLPTVAGAETATAAAEEPSRLDSVGKIPVMILVDEDEPATRRIWEPRLRQRLAEASDIFEHHCRIRFEVVAIGTWESDNSTMDFEKSLREFELEVIPAPAMLAIGFTSQYKTPTGRTHLGGARGALGSHILIREWSQHITSSERLEVLVHELGHFLGASHSAEPGSVMRPTLGDGRSHDREFRIGFDPANTLIMNLVCEEFRTRKVRNLSRFRPATKATLCSLYTALQRTLPKDPAAEAYLDSLSPRWVTVGSANKGPMQPLIESTQAVVRAVVAAAEANRAAGPSAVRQGDRLTELYIRRAAAAAGSLPRDRAAKAFLLGLGIALDRTRAMQNAPLIGAYIAQIETNPQLVRRLTFLGEPTMQGRQDLLQHFVVSGALSALVGVGGAEAAGIAKELNDSRGGSGFSFVDLSADMAGTTFASHVLEGKIPLDRLAASFAVADFLPDKGDLKEGVSWDDFVQQFNSAQDDRFLRQQTAIEQRILALPGYRAQ